MERVTGLEPATNSLEGCDSSQLSYTRINFNIPKNKKVSKQKLLRNLWAARDSNPQRRQPTDLQSAPALQLRRPPVNIKNEQ